MKKLLLQAAVMLPLVASAGLAGRVDPLIGTDYTGNTYPGAQVPFGMVQLSPDNGRQGWDHIAGYFYPDSVIAGFSHTHLSGTGAGDLYDIPFMPGGKPSRFSHSREKCEAGYYRVFLDDSGIDVELTATPRCGVQRYSCRPGALAVTIDLARSLNWDRTTDYGMTSTGARTIEGYRHSDGWARNQHLWFATRFSHPIDSIRSSEGTTTLFFTIADGEKLTAVTALSATGPEGAHLNLTAEGASDDFDTYRRRASEAWENALGKISVEGGDSTSRTIFYTALYHSHLAPTIYCDADGSYRGPDNLIHRGDSFVNHSTFSLWDTYRALHPLLDILQPKASRDMALSIMAFARQNGRLPVWPLQGSETDMMIGYHAASVLAGAALKGLLDAHEAREALQICVATADNATAGQLDDYRRRGYVACDTADWSLSKTLEYAYDDHCIARLAGLTGDSATARRFARRADNWLNLFNRESGFIQPREASGHFAGSFSPDDYSRHICESNGWQYLCAAQHSTDSLMDLTGGKEAFTARLLEMLRDSESADSLPIFATGLIGRYAHGNEPSHHVVYLFNRAGRPDLTQLYANRIMRSFYTAAPDGLCGNDDCGQMSAWLVFSALGLYPVNPVSLDYEIGCPMFPRTSVSLPDGNRFTVIAHNLSPDNIYIQQMSLNGKPLHSTTLPHSAIMSGATLELTMGPKPQTSY